jgi:hypothetical protein
MKVFDIITETNKLDEAIPFTKQWSKERQATKSVKADAKNMLSDLAVWMKGGGIAKGTLTADQFKSFMNQKGLGSFNVDAALKKSRDASGRDENEPLSAPEATEILNQAIRTGFIGQGAKGSQSRFADAPAGGGASGGGAGGLPSSITSAISGLTTQQKAALKAML